MARRYRKEWHVFVACQCGTEATFSGINKNMADYSARRQGWSLGKQDKCPACSGKPVTTDAEMMARFLDADDDE